MAGGRPASGAQLFASRRCPPDSSHDTSTPRSPDPHDDRRGVLVEADVDTPKWCDCRRLGGPDLEVQMTTFDYGPIEFYVIGFTGDRPGPAVLGAIDDLVATGTVNLLDLVFARRSPDGELEILELSDTIDDGGVPALSLAGLTGEEDIETLASSVPPGASAAIMVVELLWAKAFAGTLYDAGGFVVARQGIPAPLVNAYLAEHVG